MKIERILKIVTLVAACTFGAGCAADDVGIEDEGGGETSEDLTASNTQMKQHLLTATKMVSEEGSELGASAIKREFSGAGFGAFPTCKPSRIFDFYNKSGKVIATLRQCDSFKGQLLLYGMTGGKNGRAGIYASGSFDSLPD